MRPTLPTALAALLLLGPVATAPADDGAKARVDFSHEVVPLIKAKCAKCHTAGTYKGGFSLDTRGTALKSKSIVPGKAAGSELIERVTSNEAEFKMPPEGPRLSAKEVETLRNWIDQDLPWESGFAFRKSEYVAPLAPRKPNLPAAVDGRDHPIDRIIDADLRKNQVKRPERLDDRAFARRLFLDVLGLLPPVDELEAFVKDASPDKRSKLITRVMSDRRAFSDHWMAFWNDLLRNDYAGTGFIDGGRKQISAWLYQSIWDNRPYDDLVTSLITEKKGAEGFIHGIKWRGRVNASQVPEIQFSQNVSQVFFGVNMKCASCHDSFIDGWRLDDAYGLAAVISDSRLEIARCDKLTGRFASPKFLWPELGSIEADKPRAERLAQLAKLVTHPQNGRFPRTIANRIWQRLFGRGIVHPVDMMANEPWNADLLDYLASDLVEKKYDLRALIESIVRSEAYQSKAVARKAEDEAERYIYKGPEVKRMTAEQFLDAVWLVTGTAPAKSEAPFKPAAEATSPSHRFIRSTLRKSDFLMRSLGRPNREQVVTTRERVLTTLQALDLSNGEEMTAMVNQGAKNLRKANPMADAPALADRVFDLALGRPPKPDERAAAVEMIGSPATDEGLADLLWAVFMLPEFQLNR